MFRNISKIDDFVLTMRRFKLALVLLVCMYDEETRKYLAEFYLFRLLVDKQWWDHGAHDATSC